jgi:hypothetical protein
MGVGGVPREEESNAAAAAAVGVREDGGAVAAAEPGPEPGAGVGAVDWNCVVESAESKSILEDKSFSVNYCVSGRREGSVDT